MEHSNEGSRIAVQLGRQWRALGQSEKEKYEKKAKEEKRQYESELAEWYVQRPVKSEAVARRSAMARAKHSDKPKRPPPSIVLFVQERSEGLLRGDTVTIDTSEAHAQAWNALSAAEKQNVIEVP
mmetsp:Transcript_36977/g.95868  ORF Transcript_36977/g.95868 Transcript_36977/m.95868 type:complete len:125 (-) Transcript_36977:391-765(-)